MKKKIICLVAFITLFTTGCKKDSMDDITIYTTTYPIQYLVEQIYGYNSEIKSIYPAGVEVKNYELTKKQEKDYAQADLFVFPSYSEGFPNVILESMAAGCAIVTTNVGAIPQML